MSLRLYRILLLALPGWFREEFGAEMTAVFRDSLADARRLIPQMYVPYAQAPWGFTSFFVRVDANPASVTASLQRAVSSVDPMRPVRDILTTGQIVRASTARQRAVMWMLVALAVTALLLATIGLYGVSATAASARRRELAIRAAVGAEPSTLLRLVLRQGLVTGAVGIIVGAATSLTATRALESFLYETEPRDPMTLATTAGLLLTVATLATYIPARRALATNPATVLRTE
jgi:putative ABC transport system permease protein